MVTVNAYSNMGNLLLWWRYFALRVKPVAMAEVLPTANRLGTFGARSLTKLAAARWDEQRLADWAPLA